jgi:hypothetical protein
MNALYSRVGLTLVTAGNIYCEENHEKVDVLFSTEVIDHTQKLVKRILNINRYL